MAYLDVCGIGDDFGYLCAEALGLDAFAPLGDGLDGNVFALEDGRAMKVTTSEVEAATCAIVMAAQQRGVAPSSLFRVHDVRSVLLEDGRPGFVVVRDCVEDVFEDPGPADADGMAAWAALHREVVRWMRGGAPRSDDVGTSRFPWSAPEGLVAASDRLGIAELTDAVAWLEGATGGAVGDLAPSNFGRLASGHVCLRDLGKGAMPAAKVAAAVAGVVPLPELRSAQPSI